METIEIRWKRISSIPGYEVFKDYAVDIEGNVYSFKGKKVRKLKPLWAKKRNTYFTVTLYNKKKRRKEYVHRLVASAFIRTDDITQSVLFKDKNGNYTVENLEWKYNTNEDEDVFKEKCKKIYSLSISKGLSLPNFEDFYTNLLSEAIENHINKYGLKKLLHQEGL